MKSRRLQSIRNFRDFIESVSNPFIRTNLVYLLECKKEMNKNTYRLSKLLYY